MTRPQAQPTFSPSFDESQRREGGFRTLQRQVAQLYQFPLDDVNGAGQTTSAFWNWVAGYKTSDLKTYFPIDRRDRTQGEVSVSVDGGANKAD